MVWGLAIAPTPLTPPHRRDGKTTSHKRSFKTSHLHTALIQQHAGPKPPPINPVTQNPHQDVFGQAEYTAFKARAERHRRTSHTNHVRQARYNLTQAPQRPQQPLPDQFPTVDFKRPTAAPRSSYMSLVGYARVSTREQNPQAQEAELLEAGAIRVYVDHGESSRIKDRPQWLACLDYLRPGDTLVVRRLDRIAGSEKMAIETINDLAQRNINIKSLTEPDIDTTTPMGRALFGIVAVFAQLRVDTIRQNTMRGLAHARAQGRIGGRPTVMTPERVAAANQMRAEGKTLTHIASVLGVGRSSVSRALTKLDREAIDNLKNPYINQRP